MSEHLCPGDGPCPNPELCEKVTASFAREIARLAQQQQEER